MRNGFLLCTLALFTLAPLSLSARPATEQLGSCMIDSLTGRERKDLAKWIFFSMSVHPELEPYVRLSKQDRLESDQFMGALVTRLMTQDCPSQTKAVLQEGSYALEQAFGLVGEVAMQEIMISDDVEAALGRFERHMDYDAFSTLSED